MARNRVQVKQSILAELSKGVINFNRLIKRNQKLEAKQTKIIRLSTRIGMSREGRILNPDDKIRFPLIVASINQNPLVVS